MTTFGQTLRALRAAAHLTQRALADAVGVDFSYISKIEHDATAHPPSEALIRRLARELGTDPEPLLSAAGTFNARALHAVTRANPDAAALIRLLVAGAISRETLAAMLALVEARRVPPPAGGEGPPPLVLRRDGAWRDQVGRLAADPVAQEIFAAIRAAEGEEPTDG
jgi:transcriptional regulator with XRE-family HTH domain